MKKAYYLRLIAAAIAVVIALTAFVACSGKPPANRKNDQSANSGLTEPKNDQSTNSGLTEPLPKNVQAGDIITFGHYEQDDNSSNGKEYIEWLVLAREENRVLVISKYALDRQQYNTSYTDVTWETCSLRKWLNGTFINNAFNADEQKMIRSTTVTADKNPSYSTSSGNDTTDKVFLLSITEVNKYFSSDSARQCQRTAYCCAQFFPKASNDNCWWWLRSPGDDSNRAAGVDGSGGVCSYGASVFDLDSAVRPALWIDLGS